MIDPRLFYSRQSDYDHAIRSGTSAAAVVAVCAIYAALTIGVPASAAEPPLTFSMVRSAAAEAANCLRSAQARVTIESLGPAERMTIVASGLPKNSDFNLFVIQLANAPFGLSWYQGDMASNGNGVARGVFVGRFNTETFIVAPGVGDAPAVHFRPLWPLFPDANNNPRTAPVHTFHLGLWFNSSDAAEAAGCPNTVTPFNGGHTAGIQALSTRNFARIGPLSQLGPIYSAPATAP